MIRTPEDQRLTRSVYSSVAALRQYPGPSTSRRYAEIPGVGLFSWSLGSDAADDGVSAVRSSAGGGYGAWLLTESAISYCVVNVAITIGALSGLGSRDGVTVIAGDRVLATHGGAASGIYVASAGAWSRATDMAGGATIPRGGLVTALGGTNNAGLWYLSSPTTGDVVVGTTPLEWTRQGDGELLEVAFDGYVATSESAKSTFNDGASDCIIGLPPQPWVAGTEYRLTVIAAANLRYPADVLDPGGKWDPFVAPYVVNSQVTATNRILSMGTAQAVPSTATPTITVAVLSGALSQIVITCNVAVRFLLGALTGVSLGGTNSGRTVTGIASGNGTSTVTLTLSGALAPTDAPTLILASTHQLRSLESDVNVAAGTYAVTMPAAKYNWAAWAAAKLWIDPDQGVTGSPVTAWTDRIGGVAFNETFGATTRPALIASEPNLGGRACVHLDGTNDQLDSTTALSAVVGAPGDFGIYATVNVLDIASTAATVDSEAIFVDGANSMSLHLRNNGGTYQLMAILYPAPFSGIAVVAFATIGTVLPESFHAGCRLSGGNLYAIVNGVAGTGVACAAPWVHSQPMRLGKDFAAGEAFANVKIGNLVICDDGVLPAAGIASDMAWFGVS